MSKLKYTNTDMIADMYYCPNCKGIELGFLIKSRSELLCNWCGQYSVIKNKK